MLHPNPNNTEPSQQPLESPPLPPFERRVAWHNHPYMYFLFFLAVLAFAAYVGWYIVSAFSNWMGNI